jgi:hypothetical protein
MDYARRVRRILACPFCRSLHGEGETDGTCPECGIELQPMEKLPPSLEVVAEEVASGEWVPPEERLLPWWYVGRGRGVLLLVALLGIAFFFAPWVEMTKPELASIRGFDLARARAGWLWGGAVAWFVLLPLVVTRRTVVGMRGVRIIAALFAAVTLGEVAVLMALPPGGSDRVPVVFTWGWGLYASAAVSLLGTFCAARFGGGLAGMKAPWSDEARNASAETSDGETLH